MIAKLEADELPQVIPALEAALRLRPRRALSSAQVSSDYLVRLTNTTVIMENLLRDRCAVTHVSALLCNRCVHQLTSLRSFLGGGVPLAPEQVAPMEQLLDIPI